MIGRVTRHSLYGTPGYGTGSLLKAANLVRHIGLTLRGPLFLVRAYITENKEHLNKHRVLDLAQWSLLRETVKSKTLIKQIT